MAIVEAAGLVKAFGSTEALSGLDLHVDEGQVLGVLGPNGAGKTTAVRVLTTLLVPDGGSASIAGIDVLKEPRRVRARIGLTGQYAAVDERLTARENLDLIARFFRMRPSAAASRAAELLERFSLADAADRVVSGFSGGMRRRLDIAMSLVAKPVVLFLDEPTTGLDPRSRLEMWSMIEELQAEGMTTLLTTQYLDEADRLADEIVVIDHGRQIVRGSADELKAQIGGARAQIELVDAGDSQSALDALAAHRAERSNIEGRTLSVPIAAALTTPQLVRLLDAANVAVEDVAIQRATLDDVFMTLTGHAAEEAAPEGEADSKGRRNK